MHRTKSSTACFISHYLLRNDMLLLKYSKASLIRRSILSGRVARGELSCIRTYTVQGGGDLQILQFPLADRSLDLHSWITSFFRYMSYYFSLSFLYFSPCLLILLLSFYFLTKIIRITTAQSIIDLISFPVPTLYEAKITGSLHSMKAI
jgi:hypothetical protein